MWVLGLKAVTSIFCIYLFAVPEVTPANVSGGGGSKSELVITWEVSLTPAPVSLLWISKGLAVKKPRLCDKNSPAGQMEPKDGPTPAPGKWGAGTMGSRIFHQLSSPDSQHIHMAKYGWPGATRGIKQAWNILTWWGIAVLAPSFLPPPVWDTRQQTAQSQHKACWLSLLLMAASERRCRDEKCLIFPKADRVRTLVICLLIFSCCDTMQLAYFS